MTAKIDKPGQLRIYLTASQLKLLQKLNYPCTEDILNSATVTERGIQLSGSWRAFDDLAGWVAGEANHDPRQNSRRVGQLDDIFAQLESALGRPL